MTPINKQANQRIEDEILVVLEDFLINESEIEKSSVFFDQMF